MGPLADTLRVVCEIAFRNLLASRWKTLIVGGIVGFGALLVVVGTSLLEAVDHAMSRSIIGSVAGHIQVYSSKSRDKLELMGTYGGQAPSIEPLEDFARVRATLLGVSNVVDVVPMGTSSAMVTAGNVVDRALEELRATTGARELPGASAELAQRYVAQKEHVRQIVRALYREFDGAQRVSEQVLSPDERLAFERALSASFWTDFDADPYERLELLENRIAPLANDGELIFLNYVGTDPAAFARAFDRTRIVDGTPIPSGQRGFLFSKYVYEEQIKLKVARGLDKLRAATTQRGAKIVADPALRRIVRETVAGTKEVLLQLDSIETGEFRAKLQSVLSSEEQDVGKLLAEFFTIDDSNLAARYRFFYDQLAPSLELYRVRVGDTLTIKALTRDGYVQSANLKVYGTFQFAGLEKSPQAGSVNLMDLVSFRELYGFMSADGDAEISAMRQAAGAKDLSRANVEAELFGAGPAAQEPASASTGVDPLAVLETLRGARTRQELATHGSYDPSALQRGVVLNVAVMVRDERKIAETIDAIERAGARAGLPLKAIPWNEAASLIGQFAKLMQAVLLCAVLIIFGVALVVINNALVMATLQRVREIGTLRAVGAQPALVVGMLVLESVVIAVSCGAAGALLGALLLWLAGEIGIPAGNEVMTFIFGGPRLFPGLEVEQLLFALAVVVIVSVVSSVYPAWLAMRVSPREAMQAED